MRIILKHPSENFLSIAFDVLSNEANLIRIINMGYLCGKTSTVSIVDINHVDKSLYSQMVFSTNIFQLRSVIFYTSLFIAAGVNKNLCQVGIIRLVSQF